MTQTLYLDYCTFLIIFR